MLKCTSECIQTLVATPGSIKFDALVATSNEVDAANLPGNFDELTTLINDGKLKLVDEYGNVLKVPAQKTTTVIPEPEILEKEDLLPIILLAIGLAIFLIVIVCLIIAICVKKKKQQEKVGPLAVATPGAPMMMNTNYMNLEYADTLEGTVGSMNKRKTQSSGVLLQDAELEAGKEIPATPAHYIDPTLDELEKTTTLSPEKVRLLLANKSTVR